MAEITLEENKEIRQRKWSWAGVLVSVGTLLGCVILSVLGIYLIPPLFPWSIPIYLLIWILTPIFWLLLTPARKRILLLVLPEFLVLLLMLAIFDDYFPANFSIAGDTWRCSSLPSTNERRYVCETWDISGAEPFYFFSGPIYSPFVAPSDNRTLTGLDLSNAWLVVKDLRGYDFSGVRLVGADLGSSDLREADFSGADLRDADLSFVELAGANFTGADLRGARLTYTSLVDVDLDPSTKMDGKWRLVWQLANGRPLTGTLRGADLSWANLQGADLSGRDLSEIDLSHANLRHANLSGANLRDTSLRGASMSGADLSGADLTGANFGHADLSGADLSQATLFQAGGTSADLTDADLSGANLTDASLTMADLSQANLNGANLTGTNLTKTNLDGADFEAAVLINTDFWLAEIMPEALEAAATITEVILPDNSVYTR